MRFIAIRLNPGHEQQRWGVVDTAREELECECTEHACAVQIKDALNASAQAIHAHVKLNPSKP